MQGREARDAVALKIRQPTYWNRVFPAQYNNNKKKLLPAKDVSTTTQKENRA